MEAIKFTRAQIVYMEEKFKDAKSVDEVLETMRTFKRDW